MKCTTVSELAGKSFKKERIIWTLVIDKKICVCCICLLEVQFERFAGLKSAVHAQTRRWFMPDEQCTWITNIKPSTDLNIWQL